MSCDLRSTFKRVDQLNWAWQHFNELENDWIQFECTDCLVLEFHYKLYKHEEAKDLRIVELISGTVDFDKFELLQNQNELSKIIKIRRSTDNKRKRANASIRHDPFQNTSMESFEQHSLLNPTDLEWMSLNYRKARAENLSPSKRRMILLMFQKDLQYFPSMREIRDQLIEAQINQISIEAEQWQTIRKYDQLIEVYISKWDWLFEIGGLADINKPLTSAILSNPNHKFTQRILYLYSMECFIYEELNRASRSKDASKIKYYGAFAAALSHIISSANKNKYQGKMTSQ